MKIKLSILFFLVLICSTAASAKGYYTRRERPDHLMMHVTPTLSLLNYKSTDSRSIISANAGGGIEYAHYFGRYFGFSLGAELSSFNSNYFFGGRKDSLELFDNWSSRYYMLRQNLTTHEYQRVSYISLPVKLIYRKLFTRKLVYFASAGAAYAIHLKEKQKVISGKIDRRAYFNSIHVEIDDYEPLMFGKFSDFINPSPEKQFKSTFLAIAQTGFSFKLAPNWNMHTELNMQYGLDTNIKRRSINLLMPEEYAGVTATNYIGNIRPMSVGIRVGFTYTFDLFNVDCKCHNPLF